MGLGLGLGRFCGGYSALGSVRASVAVDAARAAGVSSTEALVAARAAGVSSTELALVAAAADTAGICG